MLVSMKKLVVTLLFFLCVPALTRAASLSSTTGSVLLTKCHTAEKMDEASPKLNDIEWGAANYCLGFIQGVVDTDTMWQFAEDQKRDRPSSLPISHYCLPDNYSWSQVTRTVVKWLEDNPTKLSDAGFAVVHNALVAGYPCK
jgi:hypothetical protein